MMLFLLLVISGTAQAQVEPDWSANASNHLTGRANIYQWPTPEIWNEKIKRGKLHAVQYPVTVTGMLMPARSTLKVLDAKPGEPIFEFMKTILSLKSDFRDFKGFWDWLGLNEYPDETEGPFGVPYPDGVKPEYPMGVSLIERNGTKGFTISCAGCHSANLFGKTILGMTNRFPRANDFFMMGKSVLGKVSPITYALMTGANRSEYKMYADTRERTKSIGIKKPEALGLDTSLSQVAFSLAHRGLDPWSLRNKQDAEHPRATILDDSVADSKPAVWWNAKYKTRWLSDASVISGNPIFTNFLWNEIGRGVDLQPLVEWLQKNESIVQELTTAVFATQAPKYRDFFGESRISVERAKRGETLFVQNCTHCHGQYQKAWSLSPLEYSQEKTAHPELTVMDTVKVLYPEKTRVYDVGTDDYRRKGMKALEDGLNPLAFSQNFSIVVETQAGYVPPPLEGIWARYPYFHNNSIPNLCALMTAPAARPQQYYSGKAIDKDQDYDQSCVGYPLADKAPENWKKDPIYLYDTRRAGMSNSGHYERIFTQLDGSEKFTAAQKSDLIEFLKTL